MYMCTCTCTCIFVILRNVFLIGLILNTFKVHVYVHVHVYSNLHVHVSNYLRPLLLVLFVIYLKRSSEIKLMLTRQWIQLLVEDAVVFVRHASNLIVDSVLIVKIWLNLEDQVAPNKLVFIDGEILVHVDTCTCIYTIEYISFHC